MRCGFERPLLKDNSCACSTYNARTWCGWQGNDGQQHHAEERPQVKVGFGQAAPALRQRNRLHGQGERGSQISEIFTRWGATGARALRATL